MEMMRDPYTEIKTNIRQQVELCVEERRQDNLTERSLRRIYEVVDTIQSRQQNILYLQVVTSSPTSAVVGMRIIENGEISDGSSNPDEWPYQTVLDAIRDGWNVIKFPEMALMLDEKRTYGLGCEFILERYG